MKPKTLMMALDFTDADLDANRHGYMTKEQRVKLRRLYWRNIFRGGLIPLVWGLLVFGLGTGTVFGITTLQNLAGFRAGNAQDSYTAVLIPALVIVVLWLLLMGMGARKRWQEVQADLLKGNVDSISGEITLEMSSREKGETPRWWKIGSGFVLKINGLEFQLSKRMWSAFVDNENHRYIVYYVPATGTLLSAEHSDS